MLTCLPQYPSLVPTFFLVFGWKVVPSHLHLRLVSRHGHHLRRRQLYIDCVCNALVPKLKYCWYFTQPIGDGAGCERFPRPHVIDVFRVVQPDVVAHSTQGFINFRLSKWPATPLPIMFIERLEQLVFRVAFQVLSQET